MKPGLVLSGALGVLSAGVAVLVTGVAAPTQDRVHERLPALIAFVEQERGLKLRREVDVQVLDDERFVATYRQDDLGTPLSYDLGATYGALGVADPEEFVDDIEATIDDELVGFYDPVRDQLVVRERPYDAYLELVLVHELTHALQDQWFLLDRDLGGLTERLLAFDSLVEGDATRVERAWYASRSPEVRAELDEVEGRFEGEVAYDAVLAPDAFGSELDFPYVAGLPMVDALLARGGQELLDQAFRSPPTTSEQVLHPEALDDGPPLSPPTPKRFGRKVDEGVLGERGLALVLGLDPLEGGPQVGWEGDSYATYVEPDDRLCTVAEVAMVDRRARDRLVAALREVDVVAVPRGDSSLELESCLAAS